jgi:8-oxo-dGTP diphosphatase
LASAEDREGIILTIYVNARAIVERAGQFGTEILLQTRSKPGEPERLELPGGQIDPFESVHDALKREITEETGLRITEIHGDQSHRLHQTGSATVETFDPLFAYQTLDGPVDSLGFYFRCWTDGEVVQSGDQTKQPDWYPVDNLRERFSDSPDQFDWLTQAALSRYLDWKRPQHGR